MALANTKLSVIQKACALPTISPLGPGLADEVNINSDIDVASGPESDPDPFGIPKSEVEFTSSRASASAIAASHNRVGLPRSSEALSQLSLSPPSSSDLLTPVPVPVSLSAVRLGFPLSAASPRSIHFGTALDADIRNVTQREDISVTVPFRPASASAPASAPTGDPENNNLKLNDCRSPTTDSVQCSLCRTRPKALAGSACNVCQTYFSWLPHQALGHPLDSLPPIAKAFFSHPPPLREISADTLTTLGQICLAAAQRHPFNVSPYMMISAALGSDEVMQDCIPITSMLASSAHTRQLSHRYSTGLLVLTSHRLVWLASAAQQRHDGMPGRAADHHLVMHTVDVSSAILSFPLSSLRSLTMHSSLQIKATGRIKVYHGEPGCCVWIWGDCCECAGCMCDESCAKGTIIYEAPSTETMQPTQISHCTLLIGILMPPWNEPYDVTFEVAAVPLNLIQQFAAKVQRIISTVPVR